MAGKKKPVVKQLNAKEEKFVNEYLIDLNATQAAIRAGYAATTADAKAPLWVGKSRGQCPANKQHVWDAVQKAKEQRSERTKIDADFVLTTLGNWIHADPCDIIDETTGSYKRIHDWPVVWRQMLSAADVREIFEMQGTGNERSREKIGEIIKYKFIDKVRTLELIGKHVNVQAFNERFEHSGKVDHNYTVEFVEPGQE